MRPFASLTYEHPRAWQVVFCMLLAAVCWLALTPHPPKKLDFGWDKLNHASAFIALMVSGCLGFMRHRRAPWLMATGLMALGVLIEAIQAFVPGRAAEMNDLLADAFGILVGTALVIALQKFRGRESEKPPTS